MRFWCQNNVEDILKLVKRGKGMLSYDDGIHFKSVHGIKTCFRNTKELFGHPQGLKHKTCR